MYLNCTTHLRLPKPQDYTATAKSIRYQVPHHKDQIFVWQIICTHLKAHTKFRLKCSATSGQIPMLGKMRGRTSTTIHKLSCYGTTVIQAFIYFYFFLLCVRVDQIPAEPQRGTGTCRASGSTELDCNSPCTSRPSGISGTHACK